MAPKRVMFDEEELESRKKIRTEGDDGEGEGAEEDDEEEELRDDIQQGSSRNRRFRMEGYESDDSDGKPRKKKNDAEADDMFGEEEEDEVDKKKKEKKEVKFMNKGDIEGQEWDADQEYEDDGTKIEPFNMDEELEEGAFDEAGMYIRKKDEFAQYDNWLQGVSKEDIEKAKEAREKQERRAQADNDRAEASNKSVKEEELWKFLLTLLKPGENILAAFRRLGGGKDGKKKMSWAEKQKAKKAAQNEETLDPVARQKKLEMDAITAIADKMMAFGVFNVYEDTYEQIIRKLRIDDAIDEFWEPGQDPPAEGLLNAIPELARMVENKKEGGDS